jgi:glutathione synthase/RimK-type ligase-like ATP-grasp enzyme
MIYILSFHYLKSLALGPKTLYNIGYWYHQVAYIPVSPGYEDLFMNNITRFDVLIVYAQSLAVSASGSSIKNTTPFPRGSRNESYNIVYSYFLKVCQQFKLKAAFTTSADIIGPGLCRCFWIFKGNKWFKVDSPCFSPLVFDKFSPVNKAIRSRRKLLFSLEDTKPFNDPDLFNLFFDKQLTYETLSEFCIPTISLQSNTPEGVDKACLALSKLMSNYAESSDFTTDIIMKDRFGAGGRHVYKFSSDQSNEMSVTVRKNTNISFIIQPFAKFDRGFSYQNRSASTDIRFIYLKGKIVQVYIRVAKTGEFRCNEHQGGLLTYLSPTDIPLALIAKSNTIAKILNKSCSLYALDFITSNNGNTYLLEGNTGPGLDWNMAITKNEKEAKKLIRLIVAELTTRVKLQIVNKPLTTTVNNPVVNLLPLSFPALV